MDDQNHSGDRQWERLVLSPSPDSFSSRTHTAAGVALVITGLAVVILGIGMLAGMITAGQLIGTLTSVIAGGVLGLATVFVPRWISQE